MEKLKIVVIGLRFGLTVIENLMGSEDAQYIELHGVYDLDDSKTEKVSKQYGVRAYQTFDEVLQDPDVEAVALYIPPVGRSNFIRDILESGRHVITTKPFEADWRKAEEVLRLSQALKKTIHINSPDVVDNRLVHSVKKAVAEFDLGHPIGAQCDVWVNYREQADGGWYDSAELCPVAPIFRLGIYIINDLISLYGKTEAVSVFDSRLITGRPTVDNSILSLKFENGAVASIFGSFCVDDGQRYKGPTILNYERGTFYYDVFPNGNPESKELLLVHKDSDGCVKTERIPLEGAAKGTYLWKLFCQDIKEEKVVTDDYISKVVEGIRVLQAMKEADQKETVVFTHKI